MDNEEFIKIIKKYGEIKSVQEAFEEYPVEEEEHKGRLESYSAVSEEVERYNYKYKIGEVDNIKIEEYKQSYLEILKNKKKITKEELEYLVKDEELQRLAELREKWDLDERSALANAKDDGIEEGERNKAIEIAKKLKAMNMSIEDIEKVTGLTKEEIKNIN